MNIFKPDYYDRFQCIAAACPDSCCKEWEVDIDAETAAFYRSLSGDLGDRLRSVLRDEDGNTCMTIVNRRCPMWRQDGLCEIQAQLGHDALCRTCRDYPRLRHDYGDFAELGLELSCPEAARLIFDSPSPDFSVSKLPGGEEPDYDPDVMSTLLRSRKVFLDFLGTTELPVNQVLAVLLLYGCEVQNEIDGGEPAQLCPDDCLQAAKKFAANGDIESIFQFFRNLEILTPHWESRINAAPCSGVWDRRLLYFIRYTAQRYWLQAVSDFDLIGRVKFIVIAAVLINALGGELVQTAQIFSKEIENDPDNLEAIWDGAYAYPGFADQKLLNLLLNP